MNAAHGRHEGRWQSGPPGPDTVPAMKTLVHLFHPRLGQSNINRRWAEAWRTLPGTTLNLVHEQYPDGRIDIAREQALLLAHERIVFQHPLYWYSVPPLMKTWMDEVLQHGWAYGRGVRTLHGKQWWSVISAGGTAEDYQAGGFNEYSLSELLKPLQRTAGMLGMQYLPPHVEYGTHQQDAATLAGVGERLLRRLPGLPPLDKPLDKPLETRAEAA